MNIPIDTLTNAASSPLTRRSFLAGTGTAVAAFTVLQPALLRGAEANSKLDIGLIGCGGRGQWIADLFRKNGGYNVVALADYFYDQADEAGEKFRVRHSATAVYRPIGGCWIKSSMRW